MKKLILLVFINLALASTAAPASPSFHGNRGPAVVDTSIDEESGFPNADIKACRVIVESNEEDCL